MTRLRPLPSERRHVPNDWSPETGFTDPVVAEGLVRLGEAIYLARCRAGWSQRRLAERCGLDQPTISKLERGVLPGMSLRRLAALIGCLDGILNLRLG